MISSTKTRKAAYRNLKETLTPGVMCMHALSRWEVVSRPATRTYQDGNPRPAEHVGGKLTRKVAQCVLRPGHAGGHKTADGRSWT
jgi:hypothetical protein